MAMQQVMTSRGDEDGDFELNKWIIDNGLNDIKPKLIEHGLTSTATISTTSNEFR